MATLLPRDPTMSLQYSAVLTMVQTMGMSSSGILICHSVVPAAAVAVTEPDAVLGSLPVSLLAYARSTLCKTELLRHRRLNEHGHLSYQQGLLQINYVLVPGLPTRAWYQQHGYVSVWSSTMVGNCSCMACHIVHKVKHVGQHFRTLCEPAQQAIHIHWLSLYTACLTAS